MKKQNGVTLIALVITIIVLLILAGVSIAMLTGDNGVLSQARNSGEETLAGEAKEAASLRYNELSSAYYEAKYVTNTLTEEDQTLAEYVVANFGSDDPYYEYAPKTGFGVITLQDKYADTDKKYGRVSGDGITWSATEPQS